jgi:hypothetical protein
MSILNRFKSLSKLDWIGIVLTLFCFIVYCISAPTTITFWDSGEFVSVAQTVQASHPPGAPLYVLLCRVFLIFFPVSLKAFGAAIFSALCGSITLWFLYRLILWTIDLLKKKITLESSEEFWIKAFSGATGMLALAFSDTFWTCMTEAEVYALSTLLFSFAFWSVTKWEANYEKPESFRWLILTSFIMGLSMGVHILNLALLFPIAAVIVFKKINRKTWQQLIIIAFAGLGAYFIFNNLLFQGIVKLAINLEMKSVNDWGWGVNSGFYLTIFILISAFVGGGYYSLKHKPKLLSWLVMVFVFILGWSSYASAVIRTQPVAGVTNNASDPIRLMQYLQSVQFGFSDRPLIYGPTYASPLDPKKPFIDFEPIYMYHPEQGKYFETNDGKLRQANYLEESKVLFPRMYSTSPTNVKGYQSWVDARFKEIRFREGGQMQKMKVPTFTDNLKYFFTFQTGWLNLRYLLWNFAGRQNSFLGDGTPDDGNWESGISFIDKGRIGDKENRPEYFKKHPSKRVYFMIPLIFGLLGIIFLFKQHPRIAWITVFFFFAFGWAVTIFINQMPENVFVRERDYIFLGAYFIFALWIGIGVFALYHWIQIKDINIKQKVVGIGAISIAAVPVLMLVQGWTIQYRKDEHVAYNTAKAILSQAEKDAIIISAGDNITFPLWYLREVEGYRKDVRVIDYSLLSLDWYIERLGCAIDSSSAIKLSIKKDAYLYGNTSLFNLRQDPMEQPLEVVQLIDFISTAPIGQKQFPSSKFSITFDSASVGSFPMPTGIPYQKVIRMQWENRKNLYDLKDIVTMDIIQNNLMQRPIYFTHYNVGPYTQGMDKFMLHQGPLKRLVPAVAAAPNSKMVNLAMADSAVMSFDYADFQNKNTHDLRETGELVHDYRRMVYDAALAYGEQGNTQRSLELLDFGLEQMPDSIFRFDERMIAYAVIYYGLGNQEKWRYVAQRIFNNITDKMFWYTSFNPKHDFITKNKFTSYGNSIDQLMRITAERDEELVKQFDQTLKGLSNQYQEWITSNPKFEN